MKTEKIEEEKKTTEYKYVLNTDTISNFLMSLCFVYLFCFLSYININMIVFCIFLCVYFVSLPLLRIIFFVLSVAHYEFSIMSKPIVI